MTMICGDGGRLCWDQDYSRLSKRWMKISIKAWCNENLIPAKVGLISTSNVWDLKWEALGREKTRNGILTNLNFPEEIKLGIYVHDHPISIVVISELCANFTHQQSQLLKRIWFRIKSGIVECGWTLLTMRNQHQAIFSFSLVFSNQQDMWALMVPHGECRHIMSEIFEKRFSSNS